MAREPVMASVPDQACEATQAVALVDDHDSVEALPLVTVAGLQFGLLLGGAVITETVFAVPGVGRLIVGAIRQLDFPIVQAGVFLLALIVVFVNFTVDLLYVYLNPQIRVR